MVGRGLQSTRVIGASDAVAAIGSAIEDRLKVEPGQGAVLFQSESRVHQNRMASAMAVKHLFPGQRDLDRTARLHCEFCDCDFVTERIALPAKSATIRTRNDLYTLCGHLQHTRERAMNVMRGLR